MPRRRVIGVACLLLLGLGAIARDVSALPIKYPQFDLEATGIEVVQSVQAADNSVRLVKNKRSSEPVLDIREYVKGAEFEGFTRRGIRISARAEMDLLRDVLKEVLEQAGSAKAGPGLAPVR